MVNCTGVTYENFKFKDMRKQLNLLSTFFLGFGLLFFAQTARPQKASDILEHGIVLKEKRAIFLRFVDKLVLYEQGKLPSNNFDPLNAADFFLPRGNGVTVYCSPPLNPLNYSVTSEITFSPDKINEEATAKLAEIITFLKNLSESGTQIVKADERPIPNDNDTKPRFKLNKKGELIPIGNTTRRNGKKDEVKKELTVPDCRSELSEVQKKFVAIHEKLENSKGKELREIFNALKKSGFEDKDIVKRLIDDTKTKLDAVEAYFNEVNVDIENQKKQIAVYETCSKDNPQLFINKHVIGQIMADIRLVLAAHLSRVKNVRNCHTMVNMAYSKAEGEGKNWYREVNRISMKDNKIGSLAVIVSEDGYRFSEENPDQLEKVPAKEYTSAKLNFRKFQRFIPELSTGLAYTDLRFPKFGITTDKITGKQFVSEAGQDKFKKMNFTTMVNLTYFTPNSSIHPFWQVGIGATVGYPTFFTGIGGRINIGSLNRLAISTGFAGTWIKTLGSLSIGSEVSGTAELEKDLKFEFSFPLKPYLGIQYNF